MPRPSEYTLELAEEICEKVSNSSIGLNKLCAENPHWPCDLTIRRWVVKHAEFCSLYAQAKLNRADYLVEEILAIADDSTNDFMKDKDGNEKVNSEHINRSRLRVDTRKWIAAKFAPKVYGEKIQSSHTTEGSLLEKLIDKL